MLVNAIFYFMPFLPAVEAVAPIDAPIGEKRFLFFWLVDRHEQLEHRAVEDSGAGARQVARVEALVAGEALVEGRVVDALR